MKLEIVEINEGHGQITYKTKNSENETIFYCLQEQFKNQVRFMRCSQDWEPQSEARPKGDSVIEIEFAIGTSQLIEACNRFIFNHPNFEGVN